MPNDQDQNWNLLWDLFDQIIQSDDADAVWQEVQSHHPDLVTELRRLVAAHETDTSLLDQPSSSQLDLASDVPKTIGDYQILESLSSGGFGDVYLGQKQIDDYQHQVAIKLAPQGRYASLVLDSFNNELAVLLQLNHPHIERLYEGGITADHIPYLVVEFIDGRHIDDHCDQAKLGVQDRIILFQKICDAVANMHRSLLVHRDIKPSNVMVDTDGVPKLLDFGIAKLLNESANDEAKLSDQFMSPAYASPEQLQGQSITTASDVYALGKLLYWLLCGRLPHAIDDQNSSRLIQQITAEPAPAASTNINPEAVIAQLEPRLKTRLEGEIDAILAKAIALDPDQRYASARELAADLHRYLNHQPIAAKKDTVVYRAHKFVQRHVLGTLSAMVFVVALVSLSVLLFHRGQDLATALEISETEKNRSKQVTQFLVDVFKKSDPLKNNLGQVNAKDLIDQAATELAQFDPETEQLLSQTLGQIYLNMSDLEQAEQLLTKAHQNMDDLPLDQRISLHLAQISLLEKQGQLETAYGLINDFRTTHSNTEFSPLSGLQLALAQGQVEYQMGQLQTATNTLNAAAAQWPTTSEVAQIKADMDQLLGNIHWRLGQFDEVEVHYQASFQSNVSRLGAEHDLSLKSRSALGVLAYARGQYEQAKKYLEPVLASRQKQLGDRHYLTAEDHNRLGVTLYELGDLPGAESHYQAALIGFEHSHLAGSIKHARVLNNLGLIKRQQQQYSTASQLFQQALSIQTELLGGDHPDLASMLNNLGLSAYDQGQFETALSWFQQAHDIQVQANQADNVNIAFAMTNMGRMLLHLGRYAEAESWIDRAIQMRAEKLGTNHLLYAASLMAQAEWAALTGDQILAMSSGKGALAIRQDQLPDSDWRVADTRLLIGSLAGSSTASELACDYVILTAQFGLDHPRSVQARLRTNLESTAACEPKTP